MRFSDYEQLRFERRNNGVLLITLDRPDKYNAADEQMHGAIGRIRSGRNPATPRRTGVSSGRSEICLARGYELLRVRNGDAQHHVIMAGGNAVASW
jgi:enoyl-CoA hydratase